MLKYLASAAVIGALITPAAAGNFLISPRGEIVYANLSFDPVDVDVDAAGVRLGADFVKFFGAEVELLKGITDVEQAGVTLELDYQAGVYGVARYPVIPTTWLYARVGLLQGKTTVSGPGGSSSETEDGLSYGVGAQVNLPATPFGARIGFDRIDYGDDVEADELSFSVVYRF